MVQMNAACCNPAPSYEYAEQGKEERFGQVDVYVTRPDSPAATSAVILMSDVFGWKIPQLRKVGDAVAAAGFLSLVPDFFQSEPFTPNLDGTCFPEVDYWLARHMPHDSVGTLQHIFEVLNSQGITSYGLSGYCWGGQLAIEVQKGDYPDALKSLALLHPAFIKIEEYRASRLPIGIFAAEVDAGLSVEFLKELKETLESRKEVDTFVRFFPGVEHGWTTRYDFFNKAEAKAADEACQGMIQWHKKYL